MRLAEFKRRVNRAERELIRYRFEVGMCWVMNTIFNSNHNWNSSSDFNYLFKPDDVWNRGAYWMGPLNSKGLPKRLNALRLFEQIAIEDKLYERY